MSKSPRWIELGLGILPTLLIGVGKDPHDRANLKPAVKFKGHFNCQQLESSLHRLTCRRMPTFFLFLGRAF